MISKPTAFLSYFFVTLLALFWSKDTYAIGETCTVSATGVTFSNYDPSSLLDGTGNITVICTGLISVSVNYTISLSTGSSGSYSARQMTSGGYVLQYNLYTAPSRSDVDQIWGDGSGVSSVVSDGYSLALLIVTRNYPVYGRIPAGQNVAAGLYGDTITVTVVY